MRYLSGKTAIVVGASRGLGRGIATALAEAGANVIALSRSAASYPASPHGGAGIIPERADAADDATASNLLERYDPDIAIIVAGATPEMRSLQDQSWETFSVNWQSDVRISFHWLRASLLKPLKPASRVIVVSSGAALGGSPLSGGYAGAKATQRFITAYAQDEARRAGLDITFAAVLPRFSPATGVGQAAVQAYAARSGQSVDVFLNAYRETNGPPVTPELAGEALAELARKEAGAVTPAYMLTGAGLQTLP